MAILKIKPSNNLDSLPPYLFAKINKLKLECYAKKLDVIDLAMGNPDMPTPAHPAPLFLISARRRRQR